MNKLWSWLLGIDFSQIPENAKTEFVFANAPSSWKLFILLALVASFCYGIFALYRREEGACPRWARRVLACLRASVIVILALVIMNPEISIQILRKLDPCVILLLDDSLSMGIKDRYSAPEERKRVEAVYPSAQKENVTRAELLNHLLTRNDQKVLQDLAAKGNLRILSFSDRVMLRNQLQRKNGKLKEKKLDEDSKLPVGPPMPPVAPVGVSTDLATGILEALKSGDGSPIAAIALFSDGRHTGSTDPISAADTAARQQVPIITVGIGDPSTPVNVKVAEAWAAENVFKSDPFTIQAKVEAVGLSRREVKVELVERSLDQAQAMEQVIDRKTVTIDTTAPTLVEIKHKPRKTGRFAYTIRVPQQADELISTDNEKTLTINVLEEKAKVLLIAGRPSWEYRLVRNLLIRDKTTDLSCWLQSMAKDMRQEGNTVIEKFPTTEKELFKYDLVMMFDPDPADFDANWISLLTRFVGEHAGGLMWMAGPTYTSRFITQPGTSGIGKLLPVRTGRLETSDLDAFGASLTREWPLRIRGEGLDHPLLRFADTPVANKLHWAKMPGIYWSFPVHAPRPGTQTLIEHSDPRLRRKQIARPLLVTGHYGPGRTVFMGFSGTWRWRQFGEECFDRYWIQTVRFLVEGRLLSGKKRGEISTERDIYPLGSKIRISARFFDSDFKPLKRAEMTVKMGSGKGSPTEVVLRADQNHPGHYLGIVVARELGMNQLTTELSGLDGKKIKISKQFTVEVPKLEFADPSLNRALLEDVASHSKGRYLGIDQLDLLPSLIPDRSEITPVRAKPISLWSTSRLMALLVLLLSIEWVLRKRFRLL